MNSSNKIIVEKIKSFKLFDLNSYNILVNNFGIDRVKEVFNELYNAADEVEKEKLLNLYYPYFISADLENIELMYLKELIPEEPTKEDILDWLKDHSYTSIERKEMGKVIKEIKASLPAADGKMVSEIVKTLIK